MHFVSILNFIKPELVQQDSVKLVTDENMSSSLIIGISCKVCMCILTSSHNLG